MNRRGFISLMGGLAAAPLVPWRGLIDPLISLPPRSKLFVWPNGHYWDASFSNRLTIEAQLTEASLTEMLESLRSVNNPWYIRPTQLIVPPHIKQQIDMDPELQKQVSYITGSCFDPPQ